MSEEDTLVGMRGTLAMARKAAEAGDANAEPTVVDPPAAASASFQADVEPGFVEAGVLPVATAAAASARGAALNRAAAATMLRCWL